MSKGSPAQPALAEGVVDVVRCPERLFGQLPNRVTMTKDEFDGRQPRPLCGRALPSDTCGLDDLYLPYDLGHACRTSLKLQPGWAKQWTASWRVHGREVVHLVRDLPLVPVAGHEPVRRFSWRARQRHRPGLQFMVTTGRHHGFESL